VTSDPWQCATENISQYLDVPKPTGSLLTALQSYGDKLIEPCIATATGPGLPSCPLPSKSLCCGFATAAPSALLPAYSSYGSVASSWWASKSSAAASVSQYCPVGWSNVMPLLGEVWLNDTIAFAECYSEVQGLTTEAHTTEALSTTQTSIARPTATATSIEMNDVK
jgi:hypothetical protein